MSRSFARRAFSIVTLLQLSVTASAGTLDDYYLEQFGETRNTQLQKAVLSVSPQAQEGARCGMPLKHGLRRDWNLLEQSTQKVLAKQLALPVLSDKATAQSSGGHFAIHYATTNSPKVCQNPDSTNYGKTFDDIPTPQAPYTLQSWIQVVGDSFEYAYDYYNRLGYIFPPNFPASRYNVYLRSLVCDGYYGVTYSGQPVSSVNYPYAFTSWMEIDSNFTNSIYKPVTYSPLQSLQITAAHEYHHAIQYGYNLHFDVWYAEATSTWMEDELYDSVNQLYTYLSASLRNTNLSLDISTDISTGGGYGRWLINRYFTESYPGQSIIRKFWENLSTKSPNSGKDIPMTPIIDAVLRTSGSSLSNDFLRYAIQLYTGEWTSHLSEKTSIPSVSMLPTSNIYPISVSSAPTPTITLPRYSYAFFQLFPPETAPTTINLTLTRDSGISAVALRKTNNVITQFYPTSGTDLIVVPNFDTASEVVLLVANTTAIDNLFVGFSSDNSPIQYELAGTSILSTTTLTVPPSITITWNLVAGATSYQIYRSASSSITLMPYGISTSGSYTDSNVIKDHTYYYSVIPIKSVGLIGPASQVKSATVAPATSSDSGSGSSSGGCFIATAAYGSYLHPQVQLLRNFRDKYLMSNVPGQAFVTFYYRNSPPVADFIARHAVLRGITRLALTPVVLAVAHPLLAAFFLLLMTWAVFTTPSRRTKASRLSKLTHC